MIPTAGKTGLSEAVCPAQLEWQNEPEVNRGKKSLNSFATLKKKIISSHILLRSKLLFLNSLERWNIEERKSNECRKEQMKNRMKREKTRATKSQLVSL